ncbi:unnamed protein product [Closterium sp. NIES-54]
MVLKDLSNHFPALSPLSRPCRPSYPLHHRSPLSCPAPPPSFTPHLFSVCPTSYPLPMCHPAPLSSRLPYFTQRNLLRIYPFGLRVTSSNYDPMPAWLHGAQMVAMNMQGYGRPLWIVHGFFSANGGCGYIKKPDFYLTPGKQLEGISEGDESAAGSTEGVYDPSVPRPIQMTLRVRVVVGTGWLERYGKGHFDTYSKPDFYCKVSIEGAPSDSAEKKLDTCSDDWCPCWDGTTLEFPLILPELALLCIEVLEKDQFNDEFAGQAVLPVASLKPGFRCVSLYDRKGHPLVEVAGEEVVGPRLLCHFEMVSSNESNEDKAKAFEELPKGAQRSAGGSYEV